MGASVCVPVWQNISKTLVITISHIWLTKQQEQKEYIYREKCGIENDIILSIIFIPIHFIKNPSLWCLSHVIYLIAWWFFVCLSVKSFIFVKNWFSTLFRHDVWWICPCIPFSISNKWEKIACKLNLHDNDDKSLHSILNLSSID